MGPDILGRLIEQHGAALVLYARQWCASPEDVVQDAFIKLSREQSVPANVPGWLFRVVRNAAQSAFRSARRRQEHEKSAARRRPLWFVPDDGLRLDAEEATNALAALPPEHREVIVAHLWGGLTFEEIADLMSCSSSSAHRWYVAGLSALRERLHLSCPSSPQTDR
jgi:RNA polymerase sigma factor (sigma-70 family)